MKAMKIINLAKCMLLATSLAVLPTGCSNSDDETTDNGGTTTTPDGYEALATSEDILFGSDKQIGNGDKECCFTGKQTLRKDIYNLKGWVYVRPGAELTIEAGTIIKGDKGTQAALIVEPGAKIYARGTANAPIVFTSAQAAGARRPGDWGGLIICGKAKNNLGSIQIEGGPKTKHGGDDDNDNSGVLQYVRVEFAGYPFQPDKEINGITFGSVGKGTTIDHLQVSYSNDDSYEWFGGAVNCKYLIAYKGWDDEFDTDNGFSGQVQYCLSVRDPRIADTSQSNGFESDNNADGAIVTPFTTCQFSNVTFVGPMTKANLEAGFENTKDYINAQGVNPQNGSVLGLFQAAMHIRRSSQLQCYNSVALGWPIGLIIDNEKGNCRENGMIKLQNVYFAFNGTEGTDYWVGSDYNKKYQDALATWSIVDGKNTPTYDASKKSWSNTFLATQTNVKTDITEDNLSLDDLWRPQAGSSLLAGVQGNLPAGFNTTSYIGAFSGTNDNWAEGWTEFDPQNADYSATK